MTIEVRQLLIKSQVNATPAHGAPAGWAEHLQTRVHERVREEMREQVKEEILAECKTWLAQRLRDHRER